MAQPAATSETPSAPEPAAPVTPGTPSQSKSTMSDARKAAGAPPISKYDATDGLPTEDAINENTLDADPNPQDIGAYTEQLSDVSDGEDDNDDNDGPTMDFPKSSVLLFLRLGKKFQMHQVHLEVGAPGTKLLFYKRLYNSEFGRKVFSLEKFSKKVSKSAYPVSETVRFSNEITDSEHCSVREKAHFY